MISSDKALNTMQLSPETLSKAERNEDQELQSLAQGFQLQHSHPHGQLYQGDSIDWLKSLKTASIDPG